MVDIEISEGKRARTAYSFDDVSIVPSRRTREPQDVSLAWQIDAYRFELPLMAAPMDSVVSPETAIAIGQLGGLGVLNLEGLWTRYENPKIQLGEISSIPVDQATARMQELYKAPIRPNSLRSVSLRSAQLESPSLAHSRHSELQSSIRPLSMQESIYLLFVELQLVPNMSQLNQSH